MIENQIQNLLDEATQIAKRAYAPYSKFPVGCAILLSDGQIITGVNVENAAYPVGICAERNALAHVVTLGLQHTITAIAVVTHASPVGSPCGMCRQFLREFIGNDVPIYLGNPQGERATHFINELLPFAFDKDALV